MIPMANNRMMIVCTECKRFMGIAKYYPSTGYYTNGPERAGRRLEAFLDNHHRCSQVNENNFRLIYEDGADNDLAYKGNETGIKSFTITLDSVKTEFKKEEVTEND